MTVRELSAALAGRDPDAEVIVDVVLEGMAVGIESVDVDNTRVVLVSEYGWHKSSYGDS